MEGQKLYLTGFFVILILGSVMALEGPYYYFHQEAKTPFEINLDSIDEDIDYLMNHAIKILSDGKSNEESINKAKTMIDLGLQLLEVQDLLSTKVLTYFLLLNFFNNSFMLQFEEKGRKRSFNFMKHKFSQVRM